MGSDPPPRRHPRPHAARRRRLAGRRARRCAGGCRWCPARWSPSSSASSPSSCSTSTPRGSRSSVRSTAGCRGSGCPRAGRSPTTCTPPGPPPAIMLVGFAEGLGAAKTYAARAHYEIDPNRELIGLGRGQRRRRADDGHGRQRQPVQDGGQRLGRRPLAGVRARRGRAHRHHAAVPHQPVRGPAGGDAGRGRHRRRRRARRHRRPAGVLPPLQPPARPHLRPRRPARLHRRRGRACSACWCSTPCPGW